MTRRKAILLGGTIPLGLFVVALVNYLDLTVFSTDALTRYLLDLMAFILTTGVPMACLLEPAPKAGKRRREEGEWLVIRLTEEGYDALHAIMATQGDLSEKAALERLLVEQRVALRNNLLDR